MIQFNAGGGALTPTIVSVSAPWLSAVIENGSVRVSVNKAGLSAGYCTGQVVIGAQPRMTQNSPQTINVSLWLEVGQDPRGGSLFLPIVTR